MGNPEQVLKQADECRRDGASDAALKMLTAINMPSLTPALQARCYSAMGQYNSDLDNLPRAIAAYGEAVVLYRKIDHATGLAQALRHQGDLIRQNGQLRAAEKVLEEALAITIASGDTSPLLLANTKRPMALLHEDFGNREKAVVMWKEVRALYSVSNITAGVQECDAALLRLKP